MPTAAHRTGLLGTDYDCVLFLLPSEEVQQLTACLRTAFMAVGHCCSSILPIPFAISKTGVLMGCITMVVVAMANSATSCMLIRAAALTGKPTYEALAEWAGGRRWKVSTVLQLPCYGTRQFSAAGQIAVASHYALYRSAGLCTMRCAGLCSNFLCSLGAKPPVSMLP